MLRIIQNRNKFFILSGVLVLVAILSLIVFGLKPGIDFTGGSLLEVSFQNERPTAGEASSLLEESDLNLGGVKVQPAAEKELIIRTRDLSENEHQQVLNLVKNKYSDQEIVENRFESIGPIIGQELQQKAWQAILVALILIIAYIAYAFRKVSKPVASWKYGISAIIALAHDVVIIMGIFVFLGRYLNMEVGILFVTGLLTVLGYSVNDTIVVFDRVRENLIYRPKETFVQTINHSVNETITRSINTSVTTLLVLFSLYFLGGATIKDFILVLILGIIFGTYSSIFVASALLVVWEKIKRKR